MMKSLVLKENFEILKVVLDFESQLESMFIPDWLSDDRTDLYVQIPFCPRNENMSGGFATRLLSFVGYTVTLSLTSFGKLETSGHSFP